MIYQPKHKYVWGGRAYSVSAQKVGEHLEMLEAQYGAVTRENFLESAAPEDSPFHKLFEWNDEKAAGLYRLQQSTQIINAVCIEVETDMGGIKKVDAYVNVKERGAEKAQYVNITTAMSQKDTRDTALKNAMLEMSWFRKKYESQKWYAQLKQPIEQFLAGGA